MMQATRTLTSTAPGLCGLQVHSPDIRTQQSKSANLLDEPGLVRHTALVRPAEGSSPAWEHHIQTIDHGNGRFKLWTFSGRLGARLRKHEQAGAFMSCEVADFTHEELASGCLDRDLHPLTVTDMVNLQMQLCQIGYQGLAPTLVIGGATVTIDRCLAVRDDLQLEHQIQLAAAQSRAMFSGLTRHVGGYDVRAVGRQLAEIIEQARSKIAFRGFDLHMTNIAAPSAAFAS